MYFKAKAYENISNKKVSFRDTDVNLCGFKSDYICNTTEKLCAENNSDCEIICKQINFEIGISSEIKDKIMMLTDKSCEHHANGFAVLIGETTNIWAEDYQGAVYALNLIFELIRKGENTEQFIYDYPDCTLRGYRVFVPGADEIDKFKEMIDSLLVEYRFNYLVIEVGGAMEYKKHPKINTEWEKYCKIMTEYPGKADEIQHFTYQWSKNSIHTDNGKGSFLSQKQMKDIVEYCKERGISCIPEVPSLSHTDYILNAYSELAERSYDDYPDTYCPSNPKSYEVLFEIMDEVIDVFQPEYVHIGHDELLSICICDKCKDKDPVKLFAEDIIKIHDYLANKGIKTIMYSDKLIDLRDDNGNPYIDGKGKSCGGGQGYEKGHPRYVPAVFSVSELLPRDILIFQWLWWCVDDDNEIVKHFDAVFANVRGYQVKDWRKRRNSGISGAFCGNWGGIDYVYMQRNFQLMDLITTAYNSWSDDYDDNQREVVYKKAMNEISAYYKRYILNGQDIVTITHATDYRLPHRFFYDGDYIEDDVYHLGNYILTYDDNETSSVKVMLGENIACSELEMEPFERNLTEVVGTTVPVKIGDKMYYEWSFANPRPGKKITQISFEKILDKDFEVVLKSIN